MSVVTVDLSETKAGDCIRVPPGLFKLTHDENAEIQVLTPVKYWQDCKCDETPTYLVVPNGRLLIVRVRDQESRPFRRVIISVGQVQTQHQNHLHLGQQR